MSPLTNALREVVEGLFPTVPFVASMEFRPVFDLNKGDVSSSAAIVIARSTRGDAAAIASQIAARLPAIPHAKWVCERGYVILRRAPLRLLFDEACSLQCGGGGATTLRVALLLPDITLPLYARLRLVACVGFQALCAVALGSDCEVLVVPEGRYRVRSVKEVARAVREIVEGMLARERHEPYLPSDDVLEKLQGFQTVWSAHHYYDRFSRSIKAGLAEIRGERDGTLRMPPDGWLLARERGLSEILSLRALADVVAQLSTEELWVRWIMHGASTIPSGDFDPAVVLFDELASPRWGLQALCERIERTGGGPVLSTAGVDVSAPSEGSFDVAEETLMKFHPLLLRAVFLKGWVSLAAFEGSVLEGLTVLEEFIREAHAFLNSPSIRQALHTGGGEADPTTYEDIVQILAGLNFALSGILPLAEQLAD